MPVPATAGDGGSVRAPGLDHHPCEFELLAWTEENGRNLHHRPRCDTATKEPP